MATTTDILVAEMRARDRASAEIKKVKAEVGGLTGAVKQFGAAQAAVAGLAGAAFLGSLKSVISEAAKEQTSIRQMARALERVGVSYGSAADKINAFTSELQATTRFGDSDTRNTLRMLVSLTGNYSQATFDAARAVADFAEGAMMPLSGATRLVSQAVAGNLSALTRYIPAVKEVNAETFKTLDVSERTRVVVEALSGAFGGSAKAISKSEQAMANLANTWGDAKEALGGLLTAGDVLPKVLNGVVGGLRDMERSFNVLDDPMGATAAGVESMVTAIPALGLVVRAASAAFGVDLSDALVKYAIPALRGAKEEAAAVAAALEDVSGVSLKMPDVFGAGAAQEKAGAAGASMAAFAKERRKAAGKAGEAAADAWLDAFVSGMSGSGPAAAAAIDQVFEELEEFEAGLEPAIEFYSDFAGEVVNATAEMGDSIAAILSGVAHQGENFADTMGAALKSVIPSAEMMGGAVFDALMAVADGEATFSEAMRNMTSTVLLELARQATVESLMQAAKAIAALAEGNVPGAILHGKSALAFALIAGGAGAVGIAARPPKKREKKEKELDPFAGAGESAAGGGGREGPQNVTIIVDAGGQLVHTDEQIARRVQAVMKRGAASGATGGTGRRKIGKR